MLKSDSRTQVVENKNVYINSAPLDSAWGQPPASYYHFVTVGNMMYGQSISGIYTPSSSADAIPVEPTLTLELSVWETLSDEALSDFENSLN